MSKPLRILTAIGPGDVVSAYRDWQKKLRTISETSITFSSQEFEFFADRGIAFWAIASHPDREIIVDGASKIENRPRFTTQPIAGIKFHLVQGLYALSILGSALKFKATHAIVDSGTTHWFFLCLFRIFGIEVIPNFHNVYWPAGYPPKGAVRRLILTLDGLFFRYCVRSFLGVSPECGRQIALLSNGPARFFDYRAQFAREDFGVLPRTVLAEPIRIMFAGRVEENKGVFDILKICEALEKKSSKAFVFEICGTGGASAQLQKEIEARGLAQRVVLRGKLIRPDLLAVYGRSHFVIVPTRSDFCEGLPMVCAEAVIAGRPVITSRLSNALEALHGAVVEAREEDVDDYAAKIIEVVESPTRYEQLVARTAEVRAQFTDRAFGLEQVLQDCFFSKQPQ